MEDPPPSQRDPPIRLVAAGKKDWNPSVWSFLCSHAVSTSIKRTKDEKRSAVADLTFAEVNDSREGSHMYLKVLGRNKGASPVDSAEVQVSALRFLNDKWRASHPREDARIRSIQGSTDVM
jgi:hypothetical protein